MISNSRIVCPVSVGKRDKNVTRVIATFVLFLTIYGLNAHNYFVFLFLMYDFTTRTFFDANGSILRYIGKNIVTWLHLSPKPINAAPRKFAAGLGLLFSIILVILVGLHLFTASYVVGTILAICAFMESALGFCAGCYIYSLLILPFMKNPEEAI